MNEPLIFDIALGRTKPVNMRDASVRCLSILRPVKVNRYSGSRWSYHMAHE